MVYAAPGRSSVGQSWLGVVYCKQMVPLRISVGIFSIYGGVLGAAGIGPPIYWLLWLPSHPDLPPRIPWGWGWCVNSLGGRVSHFANKKMVYAYTTKTFHYLG